MNHIRDKKRWWVANFCRPTVAPQYLPMPGLAFGLGLVGLMVLLMTWMASDFGTVSGVSMAVVLAVPAAGERRSISMKRQRTGIAESAEAILNKAATEKRELTEEERTSHATHTADIKSLNGMIADAETAEAALVDAPSLTIDRRPASELAEDHVISGMPKEAQIISAYGRPKLFKGEGAAANAYKAGMWLMATIFGREDAKEWCKANGLQMRWLDKNFKDSVRNVSQERTNAGGGFLVPQVLENMIIDLREEYGFFRQFAQVKPMSSDNVNFPRRDGGLTAYPVGESTAATETTKSWGQVSLTARKWMVLTRYTNEIAEDAIINVAEDLAKEIAYAFAYAEDNAGFNGDGSSTYHNIVGVKVRFDNQVSSGASTLTGALDAASGHDTFAEIDNTDLTNLMAKLPRYAERSAAWYCSQACWAAVFSRLAAAAGGNTRDSMTGGKTSPMYLGYPVLISQSMPTSTGDLSDKCMLMYGDMSQAVMMGTRRGITIASSEHIYFTTDEIAIRGTERFDLNVHDVGNTSTAGPLVALIGE